MPTYVCVQTHTHIKKSVHTLQFIGLALAGAEGYEKISKVKDVPSLRLCTLSCKSTGDIQVNPHAAQTFTSGGGIWLLHCHSGSLTPP